MSDVSPGSCLWRFGPLGGHGREQHFSFLSFLVVSSARRQLQLSFSLGCGYILHSFICCPASQSLRDCGRVLEQIGALMAPAAAAPIAGCPCGRAAAAPPFILYNKGQDRVMDGSHDAAPKTWSPSWRIARRRARQLVSCSWALRVHCLGARCSVQLALLLGFFGMSRCGVPLAVSGHIRCPRLSGDLSDHSGSPAC